MDIRRYSGLNWEQTNYFVKRCLTDPQHPYYVVNLNHADIQSEMAREVLTTLNEDSSLPPLKLTSYRVTQDTDIRVTATVQYASTLGMKKKVTIHLSTPIILYKNLTGDETFD